MGLEVNRICNNCKTKYEQSILEFEDTVEYSIDFICSDCFLAINRLVDLSSKENDGRGVSCVDSVISCLNKGKIELAKRVYKNECDKIRSYPYIQEWFYNFFGCPTHFTIDCQDELCRVNRKNHNERLELIKKHTNSLFGL